MFERAGKGESYTADGYEVEPGEGDAVHVEIEQRQWDEGRLISKPKIFKEDSNSWPNWYGCRGGGGFSINKILHRPANVAPFEADQWNTPPVR